MLHKKKAKTVTSEYTVFARYQNVLAKYVISLTFAGTLNRREQLIIHYKYQPDQPTVRFYAGTVYPRK